MKTKVNNPKTILVVDDDFTMRKGISLMLKGQGYHVLEAVDGGAALLILNDKAVDLVILDLFLPGRDGIEISAEIKEKKIKTKILLLTAYEEHARVKLARQLFQDNYMEKKYLDEMLPDKLKHLFNT